MDSANLLAAVLALGPSIAVREKSDRTAVTVPAGEWKAVALRLRNDAGLAFDMLCAHTAIDWPAQERIELIYELYSTSQRHALQVSVPVPRGEALAPSVSEIWEIAEWQEREVYDLFGVLFAGHPDLRRLFLEDDWKGFPLRKDYKDDFMLERPW